jgi:hypothetical protein
MTTTTPTHSDLNSLDERISLALVALRQARLPPSG